MLSHAVELARVRLGLLVVELEFERDRLTRLLVAALLAFFCLGFGVLALAIFFTVLLWDTQRLLPLAVLSALLLAAGIAAVVVALRAWASGSQLFAHSLGELARDREALQREP
jgi:uncharacterized membrane protein YqjE